MPDWRQACIQAALIDALIIVANTWPNAKMADSNQRVGATGCDDFAVFTFTSFLKNGPVTQKNPAIAAGFVNNRVAES